MQEQHTQQPSRILRFFGSDPAVRKAALAPYVNSGQLEAHEMEKNGEVLLLLTGGNVRAAAANQLMDNCQQMLERACGPALYATGETNLFGAMVNAMADTDQLFVTVDPDACQALNLRLEKLPDSGSVYDFGHMSCHHKQVSKRLDKAAAGASDAQSAVRARIRAACRICQADWAAAYFTEGETRTLAVGDESGCWLYRLQPGDMPTLWLADLLRRAALGLPQADGVVWAGDQPDGPAPAKSSGGMGMLLALLLLLLIVGVVLAAAWLLTDGQPATLLNWVLLQRNAGGAASV